MSKLRRLLEGTHLKQIEKKAPTTNIDIFRAQYNEWMGNPVSPTQKLSQLKVELGVQAVAPDEYLYDRSKAGAEALMTQFKKLLEDQIIEEVFGEFFPFFTQISKALHDHLLRYDKLYKTSPSWWSQEFTEEHAKEREKIVELMNLVDSFRKQMYD